MKNNDLLGMCRKRHNRKRLMLTAMSIFYAAVFVPLIKYADGTDYGMLCRVFFGVTEVLLIAQCFIQQRTMKRQLGVLTEYDAEKITEELQSCENHRNLFWFTSEYLFSPEGAVVPYSEITEVITISAVANPTVTYLYIRTREYKIYIPLGYGKLERGFYESLQKRCPGAVLKFRVNYQKADMDEYYETIKKESIFVVKKTNRKD